MICMSFITKKEKNLEVAVFFGNYDWDWDKNELLRQDIEEQKNITGNPGTYILYRKVQD